MSVVLAVHGFSYAELLDLDLEVYDEVVSQLLKSQDA